MGCRTKKVDNQKIVAELQNYIDSLPVGSKEYWEAIALLDNPTPIKPPPPPPMFPKHLE